MVADWHALMSEYKSPKECQDVVIDNVADWLAWGIDPKKSVIFVQSQVDQHLQLFMLLSTITPLGWLFRCPTFKEQLTQLKDKEINTYAFLGYPVLQAADILLYKADCVPVGEDQLPHLELTREIVRRFHFLYKSNIFIEPQPLLTNIPKLLGLDGRKMSKSYNNFITLDESDDYIKEKTLSMFTDPARLKKSDPGHPQVCNVFSYYKVFQDQKSDEVYKWCTTATKGCRDCKSILAQALSELIGQKRAKKKKLLKDKEFVRSVLSQGATKASEFASATIDAAKKAVFS
jgi:tryptophanyl-tRNA synthetase